MYRSLSTPRFSSKNGAVNYKSRTPIELDQLRVIAPSVFAEQKHADRSARYTYIPKAWLDGQNARKSHEYTDHIHPMKNRSETP